MIRYVFRGLWKKSITVLLSLFLLTAAIFLSLLASALVSVSSANTPKAHLTVAKATANGEAAEMKTMIDRVRSRSAFLRDVDARVVAKGYSPQIMSYIPSSDPTLVTHANYCVLVVKLNRVTVTKNQKIGNLSYLHEYEMEIEQVVAMHEVYEDLDVGSTIKMGYSLRAETDGWSEEGKTYLISGTLYTGEGDGDTSYHLKYLKSGKTEYRKTVEQNGMHELYTQITGEKIPFISTLNMPLGEFMKTEMGQLWREVILPIPEVSYRSVDVIGTDILDSIVAFNMEEATVIEGDVFTQEQYDTGASVCLVSEEWARYNGYSVGDTVSLSLYWPQNQVAIPSPSTYQPYSGFFHAADYQIIGIYRNAMAYDGTSGGIHPNTVFVPLRSMGEELVDSSNISFVIEENKENGFEIEMQQLGYGNWMKYYSGPQAEDALAEMAAEDARERWVAEVADKAASLQRIGALLAVFAVFLTVWRGRKEIGQFYRIETAEKVLFGHFLLQTLLLGLLSLCLSAAAAEALLPTWVPQLLYRWADPAFADRLTETLAACPPMGGTLLIALGAISGCGILFAILGMKRSYHYEYKEGSEK